jgi:hypothetical protein
LELPHGVPSHDTIGRLLIALKPAVFQAYFREWVAALVAAREQPSATIFGRPPPPFSTALNSADVKHLDF